MAEISVVEETQGRTAEAGLVSSIKQKIEDASKQVFIFRILENSRSKNNRSYTPTKVSIGPLHRGRRELEPMEYKKWKYSASLLNRKPNLQESLNACVKALRESERRARNCYGESVSLSSDDFVQTMLVDCCFIIELLLRYSVKGLGRRNDDLFTTPGLLFLLCRDMILLENQVPLFILQQMFHIVPIPVQCSISFRELASRFFRNMVPGDLEYLNDRFSQEGYHLLDLIRRCIVPNRPKFIPTEGDIPAKSLDPAKTLWKAGIGFKKGKSYSLLDVYFSRGVLTIPRLNIHGCVEEVFGNLIELESGLVNAHQTTSYAFLMRCLVRSEEDVKFLGEQGILEFSEGKEKEVVEMFQRLGKEVTAKDFYYLRLLEQVDKYKTRSSHSKWRNLKMLW